jgi:hypothetical protein
MIYHQDWVVYSVSLVTWRVRTLVPRRAKMDKPLEACLLAVAPVRGTAGRGAVTRQR